MHAPLGQLAASMAASDGVYAQVPADEAYAGGPGLRASEHDGLAADQSAGPERRRRPRALGGVRRVFEFEFWSKLLGAHPDSPAVCSWVLMLALLVMASYNIAQVVREVTPGVTWSARHQNATGQQLPMVTHTNVGTHGRAFHGLLEERTGAGVSTARSLPPQTDLELSVRAEHICGERDGEPVDFVTAGMFKFRCCEVTALRFPLAGVHVDADLVDTYVVMEMTGDPMLVPQTRPRDTAELTMRIHVDKAVESLPLRTTIQHEDLTSRYLTDTYVEWTVPPQEPHLKVQTPDLSKVFKELQHNVSGWDEMSTVTVVFVPVLHGSVHCEAEREFVVSDDRRASKATTWDLMIKLVHYCVMLPMMFHQLRNEELFKLKLHDADAAKTALESETRDVVRVQNEIAQLECLGEQSEDVQTRLKEKRAWLASQHGKVQQAKKALRVANRTQSTTIRGMDIVLVRDLDGRDTLEEHPLGLRQRRCTNYSTATWIATVVFVLGLLCLNVVLRTKSQDNQSLFFEAVEQLKLGDQTAAIFDVSRATRPLLSCLP